MHGPLRGPAFEFPDLDLNQTALADNLARHPLAMQRCMTWLKVKPDPDPDVQALAIVFVTIANLVIFGRALSLLDVAEPVNAAKLSTIADAYFHDVLRHDNSQEASHAAGLPRPAKFGGGGQLPQFPVREPP